MKTRWIYILMLLAVGIPISLKVAFPPARMPVAETLFSVVDGIPNDRGVAFLAFDYGPGTSAENLPQSQVILEHLFRKRVPVFIFSLTPISEPFLRSVPEAVAAQLKAETGESWEYGKDWVNVGFRPGGGLFIQTLAKSPNIPEFLGKDVKGAPLSTYSISSRVSTIRDIQFLGEFTGLVGMFQTYVQYFQADGYVPIFGHGCTSITIPEAYIYLDSGQLQGLLEGLAGAAWYSDLLRQKYKDREPDRALVSNTALGIAQLVVLGLVVLGNLVGWKRQR